MSQTFRTGRRLATTILMLLWFGICNLLCSIGSGQTFDGAASERVLLEQFLESRGLDRLLIAEIEMQVSKEPNPTKSASLIQRLGRLYQTSLLSDRWADTDPGLLNRAKTLLRLNPAIAAEGLELAIRHARYRQVENNFRDWWFDGRDSKRRSMVASELKEVCLELASLYQRLDREFLALQLLPENKQAEVVRKNQVLSVAEGRISHCQYLLGWSTYFLGILEDSSSPWLVKSENYFRSFLELPAEGTINSIGKQWFDLQSAWKFQALLGLAMGLRAKGNHQESDFCFDVLAGVPGARSSKARLPVWKLESMVLARQWGRASEYIDELETAGLNRSQQEWLWLAVYRASCAARPPAPKIADSLLDQSVLGLLRRGVYASLPTIMDEQDSLWERSDFLGLWAQGAAHYHNPDESHNSLDMAAQCLLGALDTADLIIAREDIARCQFLLASINFQKGQLAESAVIFGRVAEQLQYDFPELASESLWMQTRGLMAIAMSNSQKTSEALAAIDRLLAWFPQSSFARQARLEKYRLQCNSMAPERAIEKLKLIPASDPNYETIRLELVRNQYRYWKQLSENSSPLASQALEQLMESDQQLRESPKVSTAQQLRSIFWVLDAMLATGRHTPYVERVLEQADQILLESKGNLTAEQQLAFYRLRFAETRNDSEAARQFAKKLLEVAPNTPFEKTALIYLAQNYGPASACPKSELAAAISDLRRLVEVLGSAPEVLGQSQNSRVSLFRLGEFYAQDEQLKRAKDCFDRLVQLFPNRKDYLIASARVEMRLEKFDLALSRWRVLANGLEPGSNAWYEAKYELSRCLWKTGDADAQRVLQQTIRLSPQMPKSWTAKYRSFSAELEGAN